MLVIVEASCDSVHVSWEPLRLYTDTRSAMNVDYLRYSFDRTIGWALRFVLNVLICHFIVLTECVASTEILNSHYFNVATFLAAFIKGYCTNSIPY